MPKRTPRITDIVKIIKLNKEWLEIEIGAEDIIGQNGMITDIDSFEEIGLRYQIEIPDNATEGSKSYRRLWLPEEWFEILEWK